MKSSNNSAYTLEEILALFNEELVSNWTKLTSLIRAYEGIGYDDAKRKALNLLKNDEAEEYIQQVRSAVKRQHLGESTPLKQTTDQVDKKTDPKPDQDNPKIGSLGIKLKNQKTIYEKNYDRLMKIAPGLEERLLNYKSSEYIYGKSESTGYMDFTLEVLDRDKTGFYISITHYYTQNGDLVPDPDMEILVRLENKTVEALHFQDWMRYHEVYDDKRKRAMVNTKQKESQNKFLQDWFKNLKNQGHVIEWKDDDDSTPSSEIIDHYKKENVPQETKLHVVPPVEEPKKEKEEPKQEKEQKQDEKPKETPDEPELAKIISLNPGLTLEEQKQVIERFIGVVSAIKKKTKNIAMLDALNIFKEGKAIPYLLDALDSVKARDYNHLLELNYLRLNLVVPNLLEMLAQEDGVIRLVSSKTKTAFRIELGDERKENVVVLGIHQMNKKKPEPTLLVKIQKDKGTIASDLSINGFAGLADFNADAQSKYLEPKYESALGFERWLKYLVLQEFKPLLVQLKKVEDVPVTEPKSELEETPEEEKKHSKYYINKDIPHMEPGHGWLTEAHKKYGVTQEMIDWINEHDKPVVVIPRKKIMVHNTVDREADLKKQALAPGLRLSRHFLFYPEGRSNRADRTRNGY